MERDGEGMYVMLVARRMRYVCTVWYWTVHEAAEKAADLRPLGVLLQKSRQESGDANRRACVCVRCLLGTYARGFLRLVM